MMDICIPVEDDQFNFVRTSNVFFYFYLDLCKNKFKNLIWTDKFKIFISRTAKILRFFLKGIFYKSIFKLLDRTRKKKIRFIQFVVHENKQIFRRKKNFQ